MCSDVVISAPYGENGGVIYIYHGSLGGIVEPASQVQEIMEMCLARILCVAM